MGLSSAKLPLRDPSTSNGAPLLILGATSDDKGAQLEALLETMLVSQGYSEVRRNLVTAGGNEIDVAAVRVSPVGTQTQTTPLMCEAKAYASSLSMPTWHKFLGKLHLARIEDASTVGILVALSGINGNVAGSYAQLQKSDKAVFVIEGRDIARDARERGELSAVDDVRDALLTRLGHTPVDLDVAYYAGTYMWIARWIDDSYSVVAGHGEPLSTQQLDALAPALMNSLTGTLVPSEPEQAAIEARHALRVRMIDQLFHGDHPLVPAEQDDDDPAAYLSTQPFCVTDDGHLRLLAPEEMDERTVSRLFLAVFEQQVSVKELRFVADGLHAPYVQRLVELMPLTQHGFELDEAGRQFLGTVAPLFPSLWALLSTPFALITTHRDGSVEEEDPDTLAADTNNFWAEVIQLVKADYVNPALRALLYDDLGVAELETRTSLVVKTKKEIAGEVAASVRDVVRQMDAKEFGGAGIAYVAIRLMPNAQQPWDEAHPEHPDEAVQEIEPRT